MQVRTIGLAIVGQTADLVPRREALRAPRRHRTVESIPLIAELDHDEEDRGRRRRDRARRQGRNGAFMKTLPDAQVLAETMLALGSAPAANVCASSRTWMSHSPGPCGNALDSSRLRRRSGRRAAGSRRAHCDSGARTCCRTLQPRDQPPRGPPPRRAGGGRSLVVRADPRRAATRRGRHAEGAARPRGLPRPTPVRARARRAPSWRLPMPTSAPEDGSPRTGSDRPRWDRVREDAGNLVEGEALAEIHAHDKARVRPPPTCSPPTSWAASLRARSTIGLSPAGMRR